MVWLGFIARWTTSCSRRAGEAVGVEGGVRRRRHALVVGVGHQPGHPPGLGLAVADLRPVVEAGAVHEVVGDDLVDRGAEHGGVVVGAVDPVLLEPGAVEPALERDLEDVVEALVAVPERLHRQRRRIDALGVARPRRHEADPATVQRGEHLGPVGEAEVVAVRRAQPDALDAEQAPQGLGRLTHLLLDRHHRRGEERAALPVVVLQQGVAVGVLLDVEQRVVDERLEGLDVVDERAPAHEQRPRHAVVLVVATDHLEGAAGRRAVDRLAEPVGAETGEAFADGARLDVVSDEQRGHVRPPRRVRPGRRPGRRPARMWRSR